MLFLLKKLKNKNKKHPYCLAFLNSKDVVHNMYVLDGVPGEIRTPDRRLRRPLLYPAELLGQFLERVMGIEPTTSAWKAGVLPLNYTRILN